MTEEFMMKRINALLGEDFEGTTQPDYIYSILEDIVEYNNVRFEQDRITVQPIVNTPFNILKLFVTFKRLDGKWDTVIIPYNYPECVLRKNEGQYESLFDVLSETY